MQIDLGPAGPTLYKRPFLLLASRCRGTTFAAYKSALQCAMQYMPYYGLDPHQARDIIIYLDRDYEGKWAQQNKVICAFLKIDVPGAPMLRERMAYNHLRLREQYDRSALTKKQQDSTLTWTHVQNQRHRLAANKHRSRKDNEDFLLLFMFASFPPKRYEYASVRITEGYQPCRVEHETPQITRRHYEFDHSQNRLYLGSKTLVLTQHKTSRSTGPIRIGLPGPVMDEIRDSLRYYPRKYLFECKLKEQGWSPNYMCKRIANLIPGHKVGCNILRKLAISKWHESGHGQTRMLADAMGHSLGTAMEYYNQAERSILAQHNCLNIHLPTFVG